MLSHRVLYNMRNWNNMRQTTTRSRTIYNTHTVHCDFVLISVSPNNNQSHFTSTDSRLASIQSYLYKATLIPYTVAFYPHNTILLHSSTRVFGVTHCTIHSHHVITQSHRSKLDYAHEPSPGSCPSKVIFPWELGRRRSFRSFQCPDFRGISYRDMPYL
ncbi:hypothetical protein BJX70DRAFT_358153 [Aspergillus crustosus]